MENKMYLIHEEDYIKHIREKSILYAMLNDLTHRVANMPSNRGNKVLSLQAERFMLCADTMFRSWGIPMSYVCTGDPKKLAMLMENELIDPEDAGYIACDGGCCCCDCEFDCNDEDDNEDDEIDEYDEPNEDEGFAHFFGEISSFLHSVFGDNATIHIVLD